MPAMSDGLRRAQAVQTAEPSIHALPAPAHAGVVDTVLIPEMPFKLKGEKGLLQYIENVVKSKGHAVVCVAEGAGQVSGWLGTVVAVVRMLGRCAGGHVSVRGRWWQGHAVVYVTQAQDS